MAQAAAVADVKSKPVTTPEIVHQLPLAWIAPSPMNPRKHADAALLTELSESIRVRGVQQPIVVRPVDLRDWEAKLVAGQKVELEIVFGERRWRASRLAERATIPAIVRPMTNAQALETMIVENLQREDITALEEAHSYRSLMAKATVGVNSGPASLAKPAGLSAEDVARRVGKSVAYVYARLKLLDLKGDPLQALELGRITAAHAVLLARLQPADQQEVLKEILAGGHWNLKQKKLAVLLKEEAAEVLSEKATREYIAEEIHKDLRKAPWEQADAKLMPSAGACNICPKRDGHMCGDPACFQSKQQAFVQLQVTTLQQAQPVAAKGGKVAQVLQVSKKGHNAAKGMRARYSYQVSTRSACSTTVPAVLAEVEWEGDNEKIGSRLYVCTNMKCRKHGSSGGYSRPKPSASDVQKAALERRRQLERELGDAAVLRAIAGKVGSRLDDAVVDMAIEHQMEVFQYADDAPTARVILESMGWATSSTHNSLFNAWGLRLRTKKLKPGDRVKLLTLTTIAELGAGRLDDVAAGFRLNPKKVRKLALVAARTPKAEKDMTRDERCLWAALRGTAGAESRWNALRKKGADDKALLSAIKREIGNNGSAAAPGKLAYQVAYKRTPAPAVWFDQLVAAGKPSLTGQALLDATRKLLAIPEA